MAISIFFIAALSYGLGLLDTCGLLSRFVFRDEVRDAKRVDYYALYRRHKWQGLGYALAADLLRALITVLIGGMLMKGAGFPSIGKQLAMLFAVLGQTLPLTDGLRSRPELGYPAMLLLFVDWRVFLVCVALGVLVMALTGHRGLMALAGAVAMPVFTAVFGGWWLKIVLAAFTALILLYCFRGELSLKELSGKLPKLRFGAGKGKKPEKPEGSRDDEG